MDIYIECRVYGVYGVFGVCKAMEAMESKRERKKKNFVWTECNYLRTA